MTLLPSSYAISPTTRTEQICEEKGVEGVKGRDSFCAIRDGPETIAIDVLLVLWVKGKGERGGSLVEYRRRQIEKVHRPSRVSSPKGD